MCDQPSPVALTTCIEHCITGKLEEATSCMKGVLDKGFAVIDIIQTVFKVTKGLDMKEKLKLEFIREIGNTHMKIAEGVASPLQLYACLARLCTLTMNK